ncbi:eukaryotic membrane protein family-domain-containing protein [Lineolata rhizophorae]|uniref:Eukaryotic membrane protein family-domain-containing protein n=1 Tax=Lineolata rhizophorae TaxID=578093 RepID=A0A6A6NMM3_9PEZI|nr:eukaryotic membrane protein family-domain-containing protein [Lineolata rhizophorae]
MRRKHSATGRRDTVPAHDRGATIGSGSVDAQQHERQRRSSGLRHIPAPLELVGGRLADGHAGKSKDSSSGVPSASATAPAEPAKPLPPPGPGASGHLPQLSPMPPSLPLPPTSIPTYLQLELSAERPSPLYIHRPSSPSYDSPYESSAVKFERLVNFLFLPPRLEGVLWFGALACLDAWLYTFTILPLRFGRAVGLWARWWARNAWKESMDLGGFVWAGVGRVWRRQRQRRRSSSVQQQQHRRGSAIASGIEAVSPLPPTTPLLTPGRAPLSRQNGGTTPLSATHAFPTSNGTVVGESQRKHSKSNVFRHRRTKSTPSSLRPNHKADILKGLLVIASCAVLMKFDASKIYHNIRGQAAIKLYVIYNVLEVCDRLFSALGQDVLECLLCRETLERGADGRSKVLRPLWMFLLALVYNVAHATSLFYQVITLNVAVNSYSNALLTLLMSNQFVEIKGTVFKKFEKENLFQLTCADVVERFQLWLMLLIIALRNIVEVGGLSLGGGRSSSFLSSASPPPPAAGGVNGTSVPLRSSTTILPLSFTILPPWTGQVLTPFLLVLGSEMFVDWLKHAYITKFNNVRPAIYSRFLDLLARDYYVHAFSADAGAGAPHGLTRRLGLPVLPLSCLFIRSSIQTYRMFLATHMPGPLSSSSATSLSVPGPTGTSPATTAALAQLDMLIRRALGRSASFGAGTAATAAAQGSTWWARWYTVDDAIALVAMVLVFGCLFCVLLAAKLVLGMALLAWARGRYGQMKEREAALGAGAAAAPAVVLEARRVGGWGVVEVDEDKRRWIYADAPEEGRALRDKEERARQRAAGGAGMEAVELGGVSRYAMVAKRIW